MTAKQTHIIGSTRLEIEVLEMAQAREWQERLSRFANGPMAARLSALFDRECGPNEVIRFDRLEVSAEMMASENWEAELMDEVVRGVAKTISEQKTWDVHNPRKKGRIEKTDTDKSLLSAFFHFLQKGYLPWWASGKRGENFEERLAKILEKGVDGEQRKEFQRIIAQPQVRMRLTRQFSDEMMEKVLTVFLQKDRIQLDTFHHLLRAVAQKTRVRVRELKILFWEKILAKPESGLAENLHAAVATHLGRHPQAWGDFDGLPAPLLGLNALAIFAKQNPKEFAERQTEAIKHPQAAEAALRQILQDGGNADCHSAFASSKEEADSQSTLPGQDEVDYQPVILETYLRNAGLVILHPYLGRFFEHLGIAQNRKLEDAQRAVHLLQFLATGQTEAMEHELHLNKLLCGLPLGMPIERMVDLSEKEKTAAEEMLSAVIANWPALGGTSIEGLRGSFLCREGKLSKNPGGGWRLQVERKAFDVLLDQVPWSVSMVKLPWMGEALGVEW